MQALESTVHLPRVEWRDNTHMIFFPCVYPTSLVLELPGFHGHLGHRALKNSSLPPHLQLVHLPGEEPLLCPQPSGGVGSTAQRVPSALGHEHSRGEGGGKCYTGTESILQTAEEIEEEAGGELLTCRRQTGASEWLPGCTPHPRRGRTTEKEGSQ